VGEPDGNHSMVWIVWGKQSDVYVTARSMGGAIKVSIKANGDRHMGLTSEYVQDALARQNWGESTSHWDRWNEGHQIKGVEGATLEFLIQFPTAELRAFPLRGSDLKKGVIWLRPAPELEAVEIALIYFPPEPERIFSVESGSPQLICTGRLADRRQVWLVGRTVPFRPPAPQAFQEIAEQMRAAQVLPSALHDGVRLILGLNKSGVRGWTEMAVSAVRTMV